MTTIILVRHGETDWNRENRFQGHADPPLNELGRKQSHELARTLEGEPIARVYSSPLRRSLETAEIVAARLGVPVAAVGGLNEIDVGSWQGLTRDEVQARYPAAFARWLDLGPGWEDGESYEQAGERVVAVLRELAQRHPGEVLAVVTHGGPMRAVEAHAAAISHCEARRRGSPLGNCAVRRFAVEDGTFRRLG